MTTLIAQTPSGKIIDITLGNHTSKAYIAELDKGGVFSRAYPMQPRMVTPQSKAAGATHYIMAGGTLIMLKSAEANKINAAIDDHSMQSYRAEQAELEAKFPGYAAIHAAYHAQDVYVTRFNRAMEDESNNGVNMPSQPKISSEALCAQYPLAAMYIKAESYANASNADKSGAGKKAMAILRRGGNITEAQSVLDNWLPSSAFYN